MVCRYGRTKRIIIATHPIASFYPIFGPESYGLLKSLLHADNLDRLVVVTNMHDKVDVDLDTMRSDQCRTNPFFYKEAIDEGAKLIRYDNTAPNSARTIVQDLLNLLSPERHTPVRRQVGVVHGSIELNMGTTEEEVEEEEEDEEEDKKCAEIEKKLEQVVADMKRLATSSASEQKKARQEMEGKAKGMGGQIDILMVSFANLTNRCRMLEETMSQNYVGYLEENGRLTERLDAAEAYNQKLAKQVEEQRERMDALELAIEEI